MAEIESTYASVFEAERKVYGPVAEAQSLISLARTASDDAALSTLAISILERFVEAFEDYNSELATHGRPSTDQRFGNSSEQVRSEA